MSTSRNVPINPDTYTEITAADDFVFQNTSNEPLEWVFNEDGTTFAKAPHTLYPGQAITRNNLTGSLYARTKNKSATAVRVTVTD